MEYICHQKSRIRCLRFHRRAGPPGEVVFHRGGDSSPRTRRAAKRTSSIASLKPPFRRGADVVTLADGSESVCCRSVSARLSGKRMPMCLRFAGVTVGRAVHGRAEPSRGMRACGNRGGCAAGQDRRDGEGALLLETFAAILRARGMELGLSADIAMTELSRTAGQVRWITSARRESRRRRATASAGSAGRSVAFLRRGHAFADFRPGAEARLRPFRGGQRQGLRRVSAHCR
jgi:hypothetical protein